MGNWGHIYDLELDNLWILHFVPSVDDRFMKCYDTNVKNWFHKDVILQIQLFKKGQNIKTTV